MAARERNLAREIVVWARRKETRDALRLKTWCDSAPDDIRTACSGSDFIILCAPVERIIELAKTIAPDLDSNPILTDVGSVKSRIAHQCSGLLDGQARFIGSHPMAGSEKTGMDNGCADLFNGRHCFVTPLPEADKQAIEDTIKFWEAVGSSVSIESPEIHDEIVANSSHLPHLLASALARFVGEHSPQAADTCGNGLRDTTRVAAGDPQLWYEIFSQNRHEIIRALTAFQDDLQALNAALANDDRYEILKRLSDAKSFRTSLDT